MVSLLQLLFNLSPIDTERTQGASCTERFLDTADSLTQLHYSLVEVPRSIQRHCCREMVLNGGIPLPSR